MRSAGGPRPGRPADGPQPRAPLRLHPEPCRRARRGRDRRVSRRRQPPPPTGLLDGWTIQRATGLGIVRGLARAARRRSLFGSWPEALLYAYAALLALTASAASRSCGSPLFDMRDARRAAGGCGRSAPSTSPSALLLALPAAYALWLIWPASSSYSGALVGLGERGLDHPLPDRRRRRPRPSPDRARARCAGSTARRRDSRARSHRPGRRRRDRRPRH